METTNFENVPQSGLEESRGRIAAAKDAVKDKLGQVGRTLKRIEVRESIVDHPFAAIGIAAGVGAIIGLARPMPNHSRVGGLLMAGISALGMRLIRQAAMEHLGLMARDWLVGERSNADAGDTGQFSTSSYANR
ncbi:MAG: hypothetical protein JO257_24400 [Deltaproteobacteria bacterium]|nr:hypothetical protein [Deltaproteobacteria bacterium]